MSEGQKRRIVKPMIIMLVVLGILFGSIIAYKEVGKYFMNKAFAEAKDPIQTVSSTVANLEVWRPQIKAVGTTRAVVGVDVTAQIAGMVKKIYFVPGSIVSKGDILVQQNADPNIGKLKSLQASAELARLTYIRDTAQYKVKGISKQQLETDLQNWKNLKGQVSEQKAIVDQLTIRAPFDGKLGISHVNPGQFLSPGDNVVTLQSLDPIYVNFTVPQNLLAQLELGQALKVSVNAYPDMNFIGHITTINPVVDTSTRNITVEAIVPNTDHLLLPGMFTNVLITRDIDSKYVILPKSAISFNPYGDIVYRLSKMGDSVKGKTVYKANQKFVTLGETRGDQVAVLTGVKEGEIIVSSGQLKLKNGSRVFINNKVTPSNLIDPKVTNEHNG